MNRSIPWVRPAGKEQKQVYVFQSSLVGVIPTFEVGSAAQLTEMLNNASCSGELGSGCWVAHTGTQELVDGCVEGEASLVGVSLAPTALVKEVSEGLVDLAGP